MTSLLFSRQAASRSRIHVSPVGTAATSTPCADPETASTSPVNVLLVLPETDDTATVTHPTPDAVSSAGRGGFSLCNVTRLLPADVDECRETPQVCGPNTVCINQPGTFRCECASGFVSASDGRSCVGTFLHVCSQLCWWVDFLCDLSVAADDLNGKRERNNKGFM